MRRRGLTLFQLLALMALLVAMVGFLMPALAKARVEARRQQSANNLKQIGLASHNYHDSNGNLPPGNDKNNFSTASYLLPYIEQDNLYKTIDFLKSIDDKANAQARKTRIPTYLSPNDPLGNDAISEELAPTNYLFNAGTGTSLTANNGVFFQESKTQIARIPDGTSNTVLAVETLRGDGARKATDVRRQHIRYKAAELKELTADSGVDDFKNNKNVAADRCASWMDGRFLQGTINGLRKPNDQRPDVDCGGEGGMAGPRGLSDRLPVGMCDGSVRFISVGKISEDTWKAAMSANGGEVIGNDF